jgi:hypothetical protein
LCVQHESARTKVGFIIYDKTDLEIIFRIGGGGFDIVLFELDLLLQLEYFFQLLASLARLEHCGDDKAIKFTILLISFTFSAGKRGRCGRVR